MSLAPGWAILFLTGRWRALPPLRCWCLALLLGTASYPVLFYAARALGVPLTYWRLVAFVAAALVIAGQQCWRYRSQLGRLDQLEWCAVAVLGLTVGTRVVVALPYPFPAWADSLHHCLITELTVKYGVLPRTLAPYFDVDLAQYHLGVYTITGAFATLSGLPSHTALVWITQWASACGALGIYYVLDRYAGRLAAVAALILVGLVLHQPAIYFSYGRVTQLAANLFVLAAWVETIHALQVWTHEAGRRARAGATVVAGLLCGVVTLTHFRVSVLLVLLVAPTLAWMAWRAWHAARIPQFTTGLAAVTVVAAVVAGPAVVPALAWHVLPRLAALNQFGVAVIGQSPAPYAYAAYVTPAALGVWRGCWIVIVVAGAVGLISRSRLALSMIVWIGLTVAFYLGQALHPLFDLMNPGFVMVMLYLPAGVLFGCAVQAVVAPLAATWRGMPALVVGVAALATPATLSITTAESFRFFVTRADEQAMSWIRRRTPGDAVFAVNTTSWVPGIVHGT